MAEESNRGAARPRPAQRNTLPKVRVRIKTELYESARTEAKRRGVTIEAQLNAWARIGRAYEANREVTLHQITTLLASDPPAIEGR